METYIHIAAEALAVAGAVGAVARWVLVRYLQEQFALKADVAALHVKVDSIDSKVTTLVATQWQRQSYRRNHERE